MTMGLKKLTLVTTTSLPVTTTPLTVTTTPLTIKTTPLTVTTTPLTVTTTPLTVAGGAAYVAERGLIGTLAHLLNEANDDVRAPFPPPLPFPFILILFCSPPKSK
ncbi:hypothetical protein T492DRAFT_1061729 [Pavlovales sp. CCMP2436]|nr:hypothetical protein T492DRAFT_1061729 [Pavlovales sp. CCMP2436]